MIVLYSFNISPYAAKVRAILRWKGLAFEERIVHPLRRSILKELTGRVQVPVIVDDDGTAVTDSTAIAHHLEERYPARSIYPADAALRARALLLEEWADEGLPRVVQPVRWLVPGNYRREAARFRSAYPPRPRRQSRVRPSSRAWSSAAWAREVPARARDRLLEPPRPRRCATSTARSPRPRLARRAPRRRWRTSHVYGFVAQLKGLDGWETVKTSRRVVKLVKQLAPDGARAAPEAYDASDGGPPRREPPPPQHPRVTRASDGARYAVGLNPLGEAHLAVRPHQQEAAPWSSPRRSTSPGRGAPSRSPRPARPPARRRCGRAARRWPPAGAPRTARWRSGSAARARRRRTATPRARRDRRTKRGEWGLRITDIDNKQHGAAASDGAG